MSWRTRLRQRLGPRPPLPAAAAIGLAAFLHLAITISIARQPFDVNRAPPHERSLVWPLFHDAVHRLGPAADFFATYHAGVKVSRGESIYDGREQPRITPPAYGYRYLPVVALTIGRTAVELAPRVAYIAWLIVLELLLAGCIVLLWRQAQPLRWKVASAIALLGSSPFWLELHMGQFTFAMLALLSLGMLQLDRGRPLSGGIAYAIAVLLKVVPLAAIPALLRHRRGWIVAAAAVALLFATNAPYFLDRPEDWDTFYKANFEQTGHGGFHTGNYGLVYVLWQLFIDLGIVRSFLKFATYWQLGVLGITALLVFWRKPPMLTGALALMFAHMISYKEVWEHHASGAVVCAVFLLLRANVVGWRGRWVVVACLVALVLPTPFVFVDAKVAGQPAPMWSHGARYLMPLCKAVPELVLWVMSLLYVVRFDRDAGRAGENAHVGA